MKEYMIPGAPTAPEAIVVGEDGAMWFTEARADAIGRFDKPAATQFTSYALPTANAKPVGLCVGPDGLWFTEKNANQIGHITMKGKITEYPIPIKDSHPFWIVEGPDGALWFTQRTADAIGRIMPSGAVKEYQLAPTFPAGSTPEEITVGPNGNLWFTLLFGNAIGELNPTNGKIKTFPLPHANSQPLGITSSASVLWFTERKGDRIGQITVTGQITENQIPTKKAKPAGIVTLGNRVWFAEKMADQLGVLTMGTAQAQPAFKEYPLLTPNAHPFGISLGPAKDSLRVTEHATGEIAVLPLLPIGG